MRFTVPSCSKSTDIIFGCWSRFLRYMRSGCSRWTELSYVGPELVTRFAFYRAIPDELGLSFSFGSFLGNGPYPWCINTIKYAWVEFHSEWSDNTIRGGVAGFNQSKDTVLPILVVMSPDPLAFLFLWFLIFLELWSLLFCNVFSISSLFADGIYLHMKGRSNLGVDPRSLSEAVPAPGTLDDWLFREETRSWRCWFPTPRPFFFISIFKR